jgi:hypothetical protein
MHYVMMDTNIFIDMIVDRGHEVSSDLVELFPESVNLTSKYMELLI